MSCSSMQDLVGGLGVGCYKTLDTVTVDFYFFLTFFPPSILLNVCPFCIW